MVTVSHPLYVLCAFSHWDCVSYVSGDFGHGNCIPSFLCFKWFRSLRPHPFCFRLWWLHPILFFLLQFCDFDHCDRILSLLDLRCFQSWQPRPIFPLDLGDSSICTPCPHSFIFHSTFVWCFQVMCAFFFCTHLFLCSFMVQLLLDFDIDFRVAFGDFSEGVWIHSVSL